MDKTSGKPITTNVSTLFPKSAENTLFLNLKVKFLFGRGLLEMERAPCKAAQEVLDFTVNNRVNSFELCSNKTWEKGVSRVERKLILEWSQRDGMGQHELDIYGSQ